MFVKSFQGDVWEFPGNFGEIWVQGLKIPNFNLQISVFMTMIGQILEFVEHAWKYLLKSTNYIVKFIYNLMGECKISGVEVELTCTRPKLTTKSLISELLWQP